MPSSRGPHSVQLPIFLHAISAAASCCLLSAFAVQASISIALGSKLVDGDLNGWVSSPNQSFRLAFYPNPANSNTFSIGVLYNAAAINTTVVWSPEGGNIQVGSSGSLELSEDGDLVLRNNSVTVVWSSGTAAKKVAAASMGDDGNFVLSDAGGHSLWQSFDRPTDTLVLGQKLPQGKSLTAGEYTASMQATGTLALAYTENGGYTYWSGDTSGANGSTYAVLESPGRLSIYDEQHKSLRQWYSNDYTSTPQQAPIRRVTLDSFGRLRIYTWSVGSSSPDWTVGWEALEDQCQIYAYCGPNGICSYNETGIICTCASGAGYDFKDRKNPNSGCIPIAGNGGKNCSGGRMVELSNTVLFVLPTLAQTFSYGDVECSQHCLDNDVCQVATALSNGSGSCRISSSVFYSGYQELSISTQSYIKYCGSNVPPAGTTRSDTLVLGPASASVIQKKPVVVPIIVSVLVTVAVLAFLQACIWWMCCRKNPRWGGYSAQYALMEYASGAPVQLSYKELRRATRNFKEKLGDGGFGAVYKGELLTTGDAAGRGTSTEVAVKRLEGIAHHGEHQFRMEMSVIGSTHHMNLVRLCGFCAEGKERLLVYEYMRNGSLDKYLFAGGEAGAARSGLAAGGAGGSVVGGRSDMDWDTRFNVLLGTARGITYLHQECHDCIIHSDIKPQNILLDNNFTAKVSDFGLAKLARAHQGRHVTMLVRGTRGYMAPEWRSNIPISVKADVFSFGMVVLETISGRRSFDPSATAASVRRITFPEWAYRQYFHHTQVESVVDERIREEVDMEQLDRAMKVAFWCLQVQPSTRPSMSKVIQMLDGSIAHPLTVPPMPRSFGDPSSEIELEVDASDLVKIEIPSEPDQSSFTASTAFSSATAARDTTTSTPPSWFQSDHSSVVEPEDASLLRTAAAFELDQSSSTPPTGVPSAPAASATTSTLPSWFQTDLTRPGAVLSQSVVSHPKTRPARPQRNDLLSL